MDSSVYLYIAVFLSCTWSASSTACTIKDRTGCSYSVVCEGHAGSAMVPSCGQGARANFIIKGSNAETLTVGFFSVTNFDSKVTSIRAIGNKWHNIESYAFKYYTKCEDMDLSNNNIKNIKDNAFRNLLALRSLNLTKNAIENLNDDSFRITESSGNRINVLDLSHNLLTTISSEPLSRMSSLNSLHLQNNRLNSLADDCFFAMKNLKTLNLRHNQLKSISVTLVHLKSLLGLDLTYNNLIKLSGFELNRLGSLLYVNASNNAIEFVESNCFNQAFDLQSIDLSNNKIKSTIDNVMFINNNKLTHLNLYNNSIEHIKDGAFKLNTDLLILNLENNNLEGEITRFTFNGISKVTKLNLKNQRITAIRNYAFSTMTRLIYLNLSRNVIDIIEDASFSNLMSLNVLDISYNNLTGLNILNGSLEGLTELYLNNNKLTAIKRDTFLKQTNLKKLDLSMNFIVTMEEYSLPLLNLQYLNVTGNLLKGPLKSNVISPSKYLRFLDFNSFNFTRVEDEAVVNSPLLARVNLSHNGIEVVGTKNFINTVNLYSLDLSYNRLTKLHISNLTNLKSLYLNNNRLEDISNLSYMSKIVYLDISDNYISELSDPIFQALNDLRVLRISNNKIKQFNNPQTNSLTKLITLSLSTNSLVNLNLSYFPDLIDVDLSNNNINILNSSFFQNLDDLQSIDLSLNNITKLTPGTFQSLKILKLLNLSSNSISNLRYGSFKGLGRTEVIDISRNAIHVLDVDIFHECTELKRLILDYNFITQLDFERLVTSARKLNSVSLGGNPILCKEIVRNYNSGVAGRRVELTSIDKVYEEDNVNGIWCGTGTATSTTLATSIVPLSEPSGTYFISNVLLIWCMVLTILILVVGVVSYWYKGKGAVFVREPASRRSTSTEFEYQGDLLIN